MSAVNSAGKGDSAVVLTKTLPGLLPHNVDI